MLIELPKRKKIQIKTANDIFELSKTIRKDYHDFEKEKEYLYVIGLAQNNKVKYLDLVSIGSISSTIAEPREIFRMAVHLGASSIILFHNHPSGNLLPSKADCSLTENIKECGIILKITLIDHIIFTDEGFYSFANEGQL